tara:strand:- start:4642 stop:4815 length:174 start_codon:yes stop_codon:yes gene_type:complete
MATHDKESFEDWVKENKDLLSHHKIKGPIARIIWEAGRVSAFNSYIQMISTGEIIIA